MTKLTVLKSSAIARLIVLSFLVFPSFQAVASADFSAPYYQHLPDSLQYIPRTEASLDAEMFDGEMNELPDSEERYGSNESATEGKSLKWVITKDHWSENDELAFSRFVKEIGYGRKNKKCYSLGQCLGDPNVNKRYALITPKNVRFYGYLKKKYGWKVDCSFLPFALRAYFAWMNGLPMAWPTRVKINPGNKHHEIRLNTNGGTITKIDFVQSGENFNSLLAQIRSVYTVTYRVSLESDKTVVGEPGSSKYVFNPFYSAKISKDAIRPGTVLYSPTFGHVNVVYDVTEEGEILTFDGHPDNSLTLKRFSSSMYYPNPPKLGSGFLNWRSVRIRDYTKTAGGELKGGYIEADKDEDHRLASQEQFSFFEKVKGSLRRKGVYQFCGTGVCNESSPDYFDYFTNQLSDANITIDLLAKVESRFDEMCSAFQDRQKAVQKSITHGIHLKDHPFKLPKNIYATDEIEWEIYSTPSRDMAFKGQVIENLGYFKKLVDRFRQKDPKIIYTGRNLGADLLDIYDRKANCSIEYLKTNGVDSQKLSLDDAIERLFDLSFDPYHCVELRWGAIGEELKSCQDNATKRAWYQAQKRLRNIAQGGHEVEESMKLSLQELQKNTTLGPLAVPADDYKIKDFFKTLDRPSFWLYPLPPRDSQNLPPRSNQNN